MNLGRVCCGVLAGIAALLPAGTLDVLSRPLGFAPAGLCAQAPRARRGTDLKSLLEQGIYSYDEGDYDAAVTAFEKALAQSPSNDAVLQFVEKATVAKIISMSRSGEPRMKGIALELLRLSSQSHKMRVGDPALLERAIEETLSARGQEQLIKMVQHTGTFGRNLVPYLVPLLSDQNIARRTAVINWIATRIGLDAVPVLQAARKHPDPVVRTNVASLLGVRLLRHEVSLATLQAMIETDTSNEVKDSAKTSLTAILADLNGAGKELAAKEYFLDNAYRRYYLNPHQNPFGGPLYAAMVYRLEGRQIVAEPVAPFQLGSRMARQALEEALELDNSFLEAQVLTLCNDAAQVVDYDLNEAGAAKNETQAEMKALLDGQKSYVDSVLRNRIRMWPESVLFNALDQALEDGRSDVARKLIATIRETHRSGPAPASLVKALEDSNSRLVRIAAATTLAFWNPTAREFDSGELVVSILSEAVLSSGVRTVARVMAPGQQANRIEDMLRELNMETSSPIETVESAVYTVESTPPDVVLIAENVTMSSRGASALVRSPGKVSSGNGSPQNGTVAPGAVAPISAFVREIRKSYRSANVPVVVLVPAAGIERKREQYESAERKVWVVPDSIDRLSLEKTVFQKIFKDQDDSKAAATHVAAMAAEALAYAASVPSRIPVKNSVKALLQVLKNRPDEVRLPCIRALGSLKAGESVGELAVVFSNAENAHGVRVEAMQSVGKALKGLSGGAPPVVLSAMEAGMREPDPDLRSASWYAFSNSGANASMVYQALLAQPPAASGDGAPGAKAPVPAAQPGEAPEEPVEEPAPADEDAPPADEAVPSDEIEPPEEDATGDE